MNIFLFCRAHVTDESSLLVKSVKVADEGTYICEAENSVGMISSEVTLTVHCKYCELQHLSFAACIFLATIGVGRRELLSFP